MTIIFARQRRRQNVTTAAGGGGGSVVDPSQLPLATGQTRVAGSYGAGQAANTTYTDHTTGITVLKLTSATVPNANGGVYHGYSEGGPIFSQPWVNSGDGKTYYTLWISAGWFVDICYDDISSGNWRAAPQDGETNLAFSLNPAQPRICYYVDDGDDHTVHRLNTDGDDIEDTGEFPWNAPAGLVWLQVNLDDAWILGMSGTSVVAMRLSDGFVRTITADGHDVDEPHIDREFGFVYISTNDIANRVMNLATGAEVTESGPAVDAADHESPMRGFVAVYHLDHGMVKVTKEGVRSVPVDVIVKPPGAEAHQNSTWVIDNPDHYVVIDNVDDNAGGYPIREHMIGMVSMDTEDVRLIVCGDNSGAGYDTGGQMHPHMSPDGKLMAWTTNHAGSGRWDVHVAFLPTTSS